MMICKQCFISGRVQGVFFRETTRQQAVKLQLTGYAKNLIDGRVEVIVCGEAANVDALCAWLWTGSRYSEVSEVECQAITLEDIKLGDTFVTM